MGFASRRSNFYSGVLFFTVKIMSKEKAPVTQAIRVLREHQVAYSEHLYKYEEKGGTTVSARELGVDERRPRVR